MLRILIKSLNTQLCPLLFALFKLSPRQLQHTHERTRTRAHTHFCGWLIVVSGWLRMRKKGGATRKEEAGVLSTWYAGKPVSVNELLGLCLGSGSGSYVRTELFREMALLRARG